MSGNFYAKIIATIIVLAWAIASMFPLQDHPFQDFVAEQAHQKEAFEELDQKIIQGIESGIYETYYVGLQQLGDSKEYDYASIFTGVNVSDVKNIRKRNNIIVRTLFKKSQSPLRMGLDLQGGVAFTMKINDEASRAESEFEKKEQLDKVIEIMSQRLNGLGVAEPIIRKSGINAVEVQLPGKYTRENPEYIDSLQKPARLEFRQVHRFSTPFSKEDPTISGYEILAQERETDTGEIVEDFLYVKRLPMATGDIIESAHVRQNDYGGFSISMNFTDDGAKSFAAITRQIAEENSRMGSTGRLAIVLDGKLYSAPTVREEIPSGSAEITGDFDQREAFELTNVLNNPLSVPLVMDQKYEVSASLAADAKQSSINACYLGAGLIAAFMALYYGLGGVVAVISVAVNVLIVIGVLGSLQATITLPGVAALVLTVGMGVDANILIFERIREELKAGKSTVNALIGGYEKAISTIVDANVTTLITAAILIYLGTGPVKGFGITLAIGICASMFCALVVSRFLLDILVNFIGVKKILGLNLIPETSVAFLDKRKPAFIISWAIVLIGVVSLVTRHDKIFGIDFTGGDEITIEFSEKPSVSDIDAIVLNNALGEVNSIFQKDLGDGIERLKVQTESGRGVEVFDALKAELENEELILVGETQIGASVSEDIQRNAIISVLVALFGILLYVALRFEIGYGVGAVVATVHDVLMTLGIFVLVGGQFTSPMLAAVLMIVGYSINDTIVVFDRIREELLMNPHLGLKKVINLAINQVISRSLLTSITTLLAAVSLYIFGAGIITDFAFVFIVGILTGTFSSIFIASPIFFWWHKGNRKSVEEKENTPTYEWSSSTENSK